MGPLSLPSVVSPERKERLRQGALDGGDGAAALVALCKDRRMDNCLLGFTLF